MTTTQTRSQPLPVNSQLLEHFVHAAHDPKTRETARLGLIGMLYQCEGAGGLLEPDDAGAARVRKTMIEAGFKVEA